MVYTALCDTFCTSCCIFSAQIISQLLQVYSYTNLLFEYMIFENDPQRKVFHNVNLSNLENVLQRNLITNWVRECTFRIVRGTNFENLPARPRICSMYVPVCPKKLWICH